MPAAFGSRERKREYAGLKRSGSSGRNGVASARRKERREVAKAAAEGIKTYHRLIKLQASGKKLTKAQREALEAHEAEFLRSTGIRGEDDAAVRREAAKLARKFEQGEKARRKVLARILGPSGEAQAVKISRADGIAFTKKDLDTFREAGWTVTAAGTVAARVGKGGIPGVEVRESDWTYTNPDTLGPTGKARAFILSGRINAETVDELSAGGFDVAAAPRKLREGIRKNPTAAAPIQTKVFNTLKAAAKKNQALRVDELAEKIKAPLSSVAEALERLGTMGLVHVHGRDLFGPCFAPGTQAPGLFDNPTPGQKAEKKALAWYQMERLTSGARTIKLPDTVEAVEIGEIVAIEYRSDKYDGKSRIWRHEVTGRKALHISLDGKVMVVLPGFKVTKRGIEG